MRVMRSIAVVLVVALAGVGCTDSDNDATSSDAVDASAEPLDYDALGLWDDGPCDESLEPLRVGLMTAYESPVISLRSFVSALEASAVGFNARGGANGACIEVVGCDDRAALDDALACVRELDEAGVVATINDQGTAGQDEVAVAMADAGIPRVASNVSPSDWADPNAFPTDASGTGATFMIPQGMLDAGVSEVAVVRVDLAAASGLIGFLETVFTDEGVSFPVDLAVPAGTTDYTQFIIAAQNAGAGGIQFALGGQEAIQVARAAGQVDNDMLLGAGFPHSRMTELGDVAERVVMVSSMPPPTSLEVPVYDVLRADLAAANDDELAPEDIEGFAVRSWIGLYALLYMIRDADMTEFTRDGVTEMLQAATDVPMLGIYGDDTWTPDADHPGAFQRAGTNHWAVYRWDPDADAPGDLEGNFVETSRFRFDDVLCGSPLGGPEPC